MVETLLAAAPDTRFMRDATRGGVATVLNEIAEASQVAIEIDEPAMPIREEVKGFCEILGLDPLYLANEGKLVAIAPRTRPSARSPRCAAIRSANAAAIVGRRRSGDRARDHADRARRPADRRHAGRRSVAADLLRAMHELAITRNIVAIVGDAANGRRVTRVTLDVGKLSGVMPDAIAFCFDAVAQGTSLEGATLEIEADRWPRRCEAAAPNSRRRRCLRPANAVAPVKRMRRGTQRHDHGNRGGSLMCGHCGCGDKARATVLNLQTGKETAIERGHATARSNPRAYA